VEEIPKSRRHVDQFDSATDSGGQQHEASHLVDGTQVGSALTTELAAAERVTLASEQPDAAPLLERRHHR
jgi:hypothetical protein